MKLEHSVLSPRRFAEAIGVSESSIKRWADEGVIQVARTAGGHRRIPVSEAMRFIHRSRVPLVRPDVLGVPDLAKVGAVPPRNAENDEFFGYLKSGAAAQARGMLVSLYLGGRSIAQIADGPVRTAMHRLGELWQHGPEGIFYEHRATQICHQAIHQLLLTLTPSSQLEGGAPAALGGAPAWDIYTLPSLIAATVLAAEGFHVVNLGAQTPAATLVRAAEDMSPHLVWLSVSHCDSPVVLRAEIEKLHDALQEQGATLVIGGRALDDLGLASAPRLVFCETMAELQAFGRGVLTAGSAA